MLPVFEGLLLLLLVTEEFLLNKGVPFDLMDV
jgi:hypothetical protein